MLSTIMIDFVHMIMKRDVSNKKNIVLNGVSSMVEIYVLLILKQPNQIFMYADIMMVNV